MGLWRKCHISVLRHSLHTHCVYSTFAQYLREMDKCGFLRCFLWIGSFFATDAICVPSGLG